jgi:2-polyprenyl-3-methyl-5-hydroxy-6-metoxy-1,4-benzoquinol methylase
MNVSNTPLSEKTKNLIQQINSPIFEQYTNFYYNKIESKFVAQYKILKDLTWPDCDAYIKFDKLPDEIKQECIDVHNFSPEIYYNSVKKDLGSKSYKVQTHVTVIDTLADILQKHVHVIENKNVIDFACKQGAVSFLAKSYNANSVLGMDVRQDNLDIANSKMHDLQVKVNFVLGDIHNYETNKKLCKDKDTAFLLGIMYHVHDHVDIIDSIFSNNLENIIIESGIYEDKKPLIWWKTEPTFQLLMGWHASKKTILVGYPTISWFDLIADYYGYTKIDQVKYNISVSKDNPKDYLLPRACLIYKKG